MATSVVMPALEMAQETGKIISWLKKEGDTITKGESLLEVETDKAVVEIEATADGVLAGVKSRKATSCRSASTIAWIVAPGEKPPADAPTAAPSRAQRSADTALRASLSANGAQARRKASQDRNAASDLS